MKAMIKVTKKDVKVYSSFIDLVNTAEEFLSPACVLTVVEEMKKDAKKHRKNFLMLTEVLNRKSNKIWYYDALPDDPKDKLAQRLYDLSKETFEYAKPAYSNGEEIYDFLRRLVKEYHTF